MWAIIAMVALQAYGSMAEAKAKAEEADRNRAVARHNAMLAELDAQAAERWTDEEQMMQLYQSEQAKGTARVRQGSSGASTSVGAPFRERAQMSAWLDFESFRIGREGRAKVSDYRQEAAAYLVEGKNWGERKKNALKQSYFKAGSSILGGYNQGAQQGYWGQPKSRSTSTAHAQQVARGEA